MRFLYINRAVMCDVWIYPEGSSPRLQSVAQSGQPTSQPNVRSTPSEFVERSTTPGLGTPNFQAFGPEDFGLKRPRKNDFEIVGIVKLTSYLQAKMGPDS
jgi:hypothetical protein